MIPVNIWQLQPGKYFFISTKDRQGVWKDHPFKRNQLVSDVQRFINDNLDKDLYFCPHGFTHPRRLKKFAEIPKLLWADLDESDPREMEDFFPTVAWESSPGRFAAMWVIDEFMTEDLNRRMTYHLKADPGGWDLTQVLRLPGTKNFKYESTPKVKLLWADGPSHKARDLLEKLPQERKIKETDVAKSLYRKYERYFSGWVRRQLLKGKPKDGKRSEVMWRLTHELAEAGVSTNEAFELLRVSPWNKFIKRRDGDEQLKREIDKALGQHLLVENDENPQEDRYGDVDEEEDEEEYKFLGRSMADVEEEQLEWVWYPYLARGEVSILEGDPGLGKSYLAQMVAAAICDGDRLPSVKKLPDVTGKVAYFDIENSSATVTKKRLAANGMKNYGSFFQEEEPFSIDDDDRRDQVYSAIDKLRPSLVVFDTINTYIGGADSHKASEVTQSFRYFVDIARRFHCSVLVLRHLTKSTKERALYRGQGSIAFAGLARFVMTVGTAPNDPETRVMAMTKINVARPPRALAFKIVSIPDTLDESDRSKFVWGEFVDWSVDEILLPVEDDPEADASITWLRQALADGGIDRETLIRMAEPRGISKKKLDEAAGVLAVIRDGEGRHVVWTLPEE